LIPGWSGEVDGSWMTINHLGMRDRPDRVQAKPSGTVRIAVAGSSVVMGYGVNDDQPFPYLLEDRLNARRRNGEPRYEFLNFGTGRSSAIQRHVLFDRKLLGFEPDVVFYVAHQDEFWTARHLARLVALHHALPYPSLDDIVRKAGIKPDTSPGMTEALLQPFAKDIILAVYRDFVDDCRRHGILAVWVYLPIPGVVDAPTSSSGLVRLAAEAGFVVVDLADWADRQSPGDVKLSAGDYHLNPRGHGVIADRLEAELRRRPELLATPTRRVP
jgi:hypothetical protein